MDQDSQFTGDLGDEVLQEDPPYKPALCVPVMVEGPVGVQHVPSRAAGGFQRQLSVADGATQVLGADPRRRIVKIVCDVPFLYAPEQASVNQGVAPSWPANVPLVITHADPVWIKAQAPAATAALGQPTSVIVAQPAAGADWTVTVPAGEIWTWQAWRGQLTTDANVAVRSINYVVEKPVTFEDLMLFTASVGHNAATTVVYQGTTGIGELPGVRNGGLQVMFPEALVMEAGVRIRSITQNIQAGDQWSAIHFDVIRSITASTATVNIDVENWAD